MKGAQHLGLIFGGSSVEHEVSVSSARGVASALRDTPLDCTPIAVTGDGRWLGPDLSKRILESDRRRAEPLVGEDDGWSVVLRPGGGPLLQVGPAGETMPLTVDLLFPLIHGWGGEDGRLQGALELAGLPYVGCGVAASAVAMDKILTRTVLDAHGIPGVRWIALDRYRAGEDAAVIEARVAERLGYPVFVKPANGGSSVGISRVTGAGELDLALQAALECDSRVIVEAAVADAREIECAVLGNEAPEAAVLGEVVPSGEFYDYSAKYIDGTSQLLIPAELKPEIAQEITKLALEAYRALDLAGFARVDFLVERDGGRVYLNEVNSLPGFTPISMFPKLWEESGLPYGALIERLVELALDRRQSMRRRRVRWKEEPI